MYRTILILLFLSLSTRLFAQLDSARNVDRRALFKMGGFIYPDSSNYGGFSFHLEIERIFRNAPYFSSGPRLDYVNFEDFFDKNFFVGYEFKFYPFYWKSKKPYQGLFLGVEPLYLAQTGNSYSRYGPGGGTFLGYQHIIRDKFSIGLETEMAYVIDLNGDAPQNNPDNEYLFFFISLKFGIKLGRPTK